MGKIANRQSLAFSERGQLLQTIPQFHVERMLNERTPIARFESWHNERRVCENSFLCFRGRYDRQRTLAIRIAAITLASDSVITIARFHPSKNNTLPMFGPDARSESSFAVPPTLHAYLHLGALTFRSVIL